MIPSVLPFTLHHLQAQVPVGAVIVLHYRRLYAKMERIKSWKEKILCSRSDNSSGSCSRLGYWLVVIAGCACTVGCTTLKKAAIVSSLGTTGALVGNAVSGTAGLVVGGLTTAAVADVATEVMVTSKSNSVMNDCKCLKFSAGGIKCTPC